MTFDLTLDEGTYLVRLARRAIEARLETGEKIRPSDAPDKLTQRSGVFVTLNEAGERGHGLRGCIGFPLPVMPLAEAVVDAAVSAALRDPRFRPVGAGEMGSIVIEVSVLTPPEAVEAQSADQYPGKVEVGKDGLIVCRGRSQGLLLPQVPVEWGWDSEEFLSQCCLKAWLPADAWLEPDTQVSKFQAIIFSEEAPGGRVRRVSLS